jgi:hypothetical protein
MREEIKSPLTRVFHNHEKRRATTHVFVGQQSLLQQQNSDLKRRHAMLLPFGVGKNNIGNNGIYVGGHDKEYMMTKLNEAKALSTKFRIVGNSGRMEDNNIKSQKKVINHTIPNQHHVSVMKNKLISLNHNLPRIQVGSSDFKKKSCKRNNTENGNRMTAKNRSDFTDSYVSNLRQQFGFFNDDEGGSSDDILNDNEKNHQNTLCDDTNVSKINVRDELNNTQEYQYAKDYIRLAKEYKRSECYRNSNLQMKKKCHVCKETALTDIIQKDGRRINHVITGESHSISNNNSSIHKTRPRALVKVLYPCEHRPICNICWERKQWTKCPFCNKEVKVAINHTGNEENEYWEWIHEIKPHLPNGFLKTFTRMSKRSIAKAMAKSVVEGDDGGDNNATMTSCRKTDSNHEKLDLTINRFHHNVVVDSKTCLIS